MSNEEYRMYIHEMYKNNFLNKGKKPKALNIFGDSYGHFSDINTWIGLLANNLGILPLNYCWAGAPNTRSFNLFAKHYDAECLNIFLFTSGSRLYVDDDKFYISSNSSLPETKFIQLNDSYNLPKIIVDNYKKAGELYFQYLYNEDFSQITDLLYLEKIRQKDNTLIIDCFRRYNSSHLDSIFLKENPILLDDTLFEISCKQFSTATNAKNLYMNFLAKNNGKDFKNHFSLNTQRLVFKRILGILNHGYFNLDNQEFEQPKLEELVTDDDYNKENFFRLETFKEYKKIYE